MRLTISPLRTSNKVTMFLYHLMCRGVSPTMMLGVAQEVGLEHMPAGEEQDLPVGGLASIAQDIARVISREELVRSEKIVPTPKSNE